MELVLLFGGLALFLFLVGYGVVYLRKIKDETGYNPVGFLNCLMIAGFFALPIVGIDMAAKGNTVLGIALLVGAVACLLGLIARNCVLKNPGRIALVTFFQILVALITVIYIIYKMQLRTDKSGADNSSSKTVSSLLHGTDKPSGYDYTSGQDELARNYGFSSAEDARMNGVDVKTMM